MVKAIFSHIVCSQVSILEDFTQCQSGFVWLTGNMSRQEAMPAKGVPNEAKFYPLVLHELLHG